nr:ABC transporter permease [Thiolinea sp.]
MILLKLTWYSLWNRRASLLLTVLSIAISVALLLGVEYIRKEARHSFMNTLSGTDLVVGARSGPIQLLLYSVFRIGNATNNISW